MKLSNTLKGLVVLIVVVVALVGCCSTKYNTMVQQEEAVTTAWGNVQNQYQRRADLIPNLVNTVKGYAEHESSTFENVVAARAKATQMTIDPTNMTAEQLKNFQEAQGELSSALGRLIAVQENYPELKANENFRDLQVQLEGTENRINESRRLYNEAVQSYNIAIRTFPANIFAGIFGFQQKVKFKASESAQKAPTVEF